jgi:3-dehydroquinate dehydratase-2
MARLVFLLNGPNLNLLGVREPHIYGTETLDEIEVRCRRRATQHALEIDFRQTNCEGVLVEAVHEARDRAVAIIVNPAAFSFHSIALLNALETFAGPKIEIHLANRQKRDRIYHSSLISRTATGMIEGLGGDVYVLAIEAVAMNLARKAHCISEA